VLAAAGIAIAAFVDIVIATLVDEVSISAMAIVAAVDCINIATVAAGCC